MLKFNSPILKKYIPILKLYFKTLHSLNSEVFQVGRFPFSTDKKEGNVLFNGYMASDIIW